MLNSRIWIFFVPLFEYENHIRFLLVCHTHFCINERCILSHGKRTIFIAPLYFLAKSNKRRRISCGYPSSGHIPWNIIPSSPSMFPLLFHFKYFTNPFTGTQKFYGLLKNIWMIRSKHKDRSMLIYLKLYCFRVYIWALFLSRYYCTSTKQIYCNIFQVRT